jgi:hypothetical protein
MTLDCEVCSRARLSRDARFDGKFFIAVLSTKIYCRPICPARTSCESNVRYYQLLRLRLKRGFVHVCVADQNARPELRLGWELPTPSHELCASSGRPAWKTAGWKALQSTWEWVRAIFGDFSSSIWVQLPALWHRPAVCISLRS